MGRGKYVRKRGNEGGELRPGIGQCRRFCFGLMGLLLGFQR